MFIQTKGRWRTWAGICLGKASWGPAGSQECWSHTFSDKGIWSEELEDHWGTHFRQRLWSGPSQWHACPLQLRGFVAVCLFATWEEAEAGAWGFVLGILPSIHPSLGYYRGKEEELPSVIPLMVVLSTYNNLHIFAVSSLWMSFVSSTFPKVFAIWKSLISLSDSSWFVIDLVPRAFKRKLIPDVMSDTCLVKWAIHAQHDARAILHSDFGENMCLLGILLHEVTLLLTPLLSFKKNQSSLS